jgi:hypothetical protein
VFGPQGKPGPRPAAPRGAGHLRGGRLPQARARRSEGPRRSP